MQRFAVACVHIEIRKHPANQAAGERSRREFGGETHQRRGYCQPDDRMRG